MVVTVFGNPGKSWNLNFLLESLWKSWNFLIFSKISWNILEFSKMIVFKILLFDFLPKLTDPYILIMIDDDFDVDNYFSFLSSWIITHQKFSLKILDFLYFLLLYPGKSWNFILRCPGKSQKSPWKSWNFKTEFVWPPCINESSPPPPY